LQHLQRVFYPGSLAYHNPTETWRAWGKIGASSFLLKGNAAAVAIWQKRK
jgi:hypothetical protein